MLSTVKLKCLGLVICINKIFTPTVISCSGSAFVREPKKPGRFLGLEQTRNNRCKIPMNNENTGWFHRHGTICRLRASAPHYNNIYLTEGSLTPCTRSSLVQHTNRCPRNLFPRYTRRGGSHRSCRGTFKKCFSCCNYTYLNERASDLIRLDKSQNLNNY